MPLTEKEKEYKKRYNKTERGKFTKRKSRYKYNISFSEYIKLIDKQNNLCAICGKKEKYKALAIDHCHTTGGIRGLLCQKCNTGIGLFGDDKELLEKAMRYLI